MANNTTVEKVEDKLNKVVGPDTVQSFEKKVTDLYQKGQQAISETVDKISPALQSTYRQAEKKVEETVDSAEKTIKSYPLQSLLVGFGAGFLIGMLNQSFRKTA